MAEKRSRSEMEDAGSGQRWEQSGPPKKKHKKQTKRHNAKEGSTNWIKKRVRTIERRFNRETESMPSNVQKDLERELAAHQKRLTQSQNKKLRQKMISKYHMVRFFERKKAGRLEKQLRQKLEKTTDSKERQAIEKYIHITEVDKIYTIYFPYMERYVSLYPVSDEPKSEDVSSAAARALHSQRPELWTVVEQAMKEGQEALERLRDRLPEKDPWSRPASTSVPSKPVSASKRRAEKQRQKPQADEGSNGGKAPKKRVTGSNTAPLGIRKKAESSDEGESDFFEED